MIHQFEEITEELTKEEKYLSDIILNRFKTFYNKKESGITQEEIVKRMKEKGANVSAPRLRKIINYLRSKGHPIMANSKWCWYSTKASEIESQIRSLEDRQKALQSPINGLKKLLNNLSTIAKAA